VCVGIRTRLVRVSWQRLGILYGDPADVVIVRNVSSRHRLTLLISPSNIDFTQDNLRCLLVDQPVTRVRLPDLLEPSLQSRENFLLTDYRAIHLTTGSSLTPSKTNGFIKIYQSRMNIDLFVFFSVFFSSFFLFLSIGICFWKVKFAYELHRRRRTIRHEYHKRMARPFAKIQLLVKSATNVSNVDDKPEQVRLTRSVVSTFTRPFSSTILLFPRPLIFHFCFHRLAPTSTIRRTSSLLNRSAIKRRVTPHCFSICPAISPHSIVFVQAQLSLKYRRTTPLP
jgi:hypothetical protein